METENLEAYQISVLKRFGNSILRFQYVKCILRVVHTYEGISSDLKKTQVKPN